MTPRRLRRRRLRRRRLRLRRLADHPTTLRLLRRR